MCWTFCYRFGIDILNFVGTQQKPLIYYSLPLLSYCSATVHLLRQSPRDLSSLKYLVFLLLQDNKNYENNSKTNDNKLCQKFCYSLDVQKWKHIVVILRERKSHQNFHGTEPERQCLEKRLWEERAKRSVLKEDALNLGLELRLSFLMSGRENIGEEG